MKITRRKLNKALGIIRNTRINYDLVSFCGNMCKRYFTKRDADKTLPYPTTLMLELTNKCNLKCTMCPREHIYGQDMNIGNMDTDLAYKIIDECYPYLQSIGLTGLGETLFAPNLLDVAKYIKLKKKSIVIFISSNANMPDFIERITPVVPYIDTLQISIDGVGEIYDKIRIGGSFHLLDENLQKLSPIIADGNVDVMFNMVVSMKNFESMVDVIDFAHKRGVRFVNFSKLNLASIPEIDVATTYDFFKSKEYIEVCQRTLEKAHDYPELEITGLDIQPEGTFHVCPLVYNSFQINQDGFVPPCCAKPFSKLMSFGNVKDSDVLSVLNSAAAKDFQRCWQMSRVPDFCRNCNVFL
ncbi:MAG: radical SAM protein [Bacteroides sp.]|nr:radical SAM protein [Bacteroides sp.]MBD5364032.1 radical SAM protein [Bacteroides sp.]